MKKREDIEEKECKRSSSLFTSVKHKVILKTFSQKQLSLRNLVNQSFFSFELLVLFRHLLFYFVIYCPLLTQPFGFNIIVTYRHLSLKELQPLNAITGNCNLWQS